MTDYKQLCADLVAWAEKTSAHYYSEPGVLIRARAALAEPEPEPPTDTELSPSAEAVLSPAAQAVLDAIEQDGKIIYGMPLLRPLIAAALRAAVRYCQSEYWSEGEQRLAKRMLMISDELEAQ